jgi:TetR/AcrR family transcriptional repressor of mexJK operon
MSATYGSRVRGRKRRGFAGPRADDPRVVRTRAAVVDAARTLFMRNGYSGTTMEDIAALAGLAKRTVYNNYPDKDALFNQIVLDVIAFAEEFARGLRKEFTAEITAANLHASLDDMGCRLALAVVRPEVIALRRLLISDARTLPSLARDYFDRVPGQVMDALAAGFEQLGHAGLRVKDGRRAGSQFAYLVVGELLDRALMVGTTPPREQVIAYARDGVETFLARYGTERSGRGRKG